MTSHEQPGASGFPSFRRCHHVGRRLRKTRVDTARGNGGSWEVVPDLWGASIEDSDDEMICNPGRREEPCRDTPSEELARHSISPASIHQPLGPVVLRAR